MTTQNNVEAALVLFNNLGVLAYEQTRNHIPALTSREYSVASIRWHREKEKKPSAVVKPCRPKPRKDQRPLVEKILLAAGELHQPFTKAELVVKAWELYPDDFCLPGFPEHPDSNKVVSYLCGKRGLPEAGVLKPVKANTYEITKFGHFVLKEVRGENQNSEAAQRNDPG